MNKIGFGILGALGIVFIICGSVVVEAFPNITNDKLAKVNFCFHLSIEVKIENFFIKLLGIGIS